MEDPHQSDETLCYKHHHALSLRNPGRRCCTAGTSVISGQRGQRLKETKAVGWFGCKSDLFGKTTKPNNNNGQMCTRTKHTAGPMSGGLPANDD